MKDRACRVMLLNLEEKGAIQLPPRITEKDRSEKRDQSKKCCLAAAKLKKRKENLKAEKEDITILL
ncbi:hypothetical protein [Desulfogranum japonicum]|uniref:hypothetical protein n=1 Tax=Desulfogranum japonicum TaxID=231447 RepID=UPI00041BC72D|nr:hypothetical protein [Desulfogranum japonicum]